MSCDDALTPKAAVQRAYEFLRCHQAMLKGACAFPHKDVAIPHVTKYGEVGLRIFRLHEDSNIACLHNSALEDTRVTRDRGIYEIGIKLIDLKPVEIDGHPVEAHHVLRSVIVISNNQARIHIVKKLNVCWQRFAGTKELAHLIMGVRGEKLIDPAKQLGLALKIGIGTVDWDRPVSREQFAWLMAIELLLPYWHRDCLHRQIDDGVSAQMIAQHFRVPKAVIDAYTLGDYRQKSTEILAKLGATFSR